MLYYVLKQIASSNNYSLEKQFSLIKSCHYFTVYFGLIFKPNYAFSASQIENKKKCP